MEPKQPEIIAAVRRYWPPQYDIDGEGQPMRSSSPSMSTMSLRAKIETTNVSTGKVKEKAAARSGVMPLLGMRSRRGEGKTYGLCRACDHSQGRRSAQAGRGRLLTTFVYRVHLLCVTRVWRAWHLYHR